MRCPLLLQTLVIADDAYLASKLTCRLARPGSYLPIIDGPRLAPPDAAAEIIRRNNAAAKIDCEAVVLAGLSADAVKLLRNKLPAKLIREIAAAGDIEAIAGSRLLRDPPLQWGRERIGVGVLKALRAGRGIDFTGEASPIESIAPKSDHLVVCEEGDDLSQVIAANYAFSLRGRTASDPRGLAKSVGANPGELL